MILSSFKRRDITSRLESTPYDLLVIGGGITGAGIALDAVTRGLKTALIEKNDFAFGTSSRSTKLIHGGLRYLKQLEFGLVKEVGSERAVVHQLAPHLVIPEKMLLPLTEKSLGATFTSIGLKIYDWLAGVKRADRRKMLTRQQTLKQEPLLKSDGIKAGALYAEYRTDDARLTIEIIKTAASHGTDVLNYCEAVQFNYYEGSLVSINARDTYDQSIITIKSKCFVNATGPWVDELRMLDHSMKGKFLHLTKGIHLVVARTKLPIQQAIYFEVEDGRMIFAIPRGRTTYIGTTDTNYNGNKNSVVAAKDDVNYLLKAVNNNFDSVDLRLVDVESSWAGLRPLISEEGKSASELSRKDEIFISKTGLISIAGGKLTGYRKMAERVINIVADRYFEDRPLKSCYTDKIPLIGNTFNSFEDVEKYCIQIEAKLLTLNMEAGYGKYLVHNYGSQTDAIMREFEKRNEESIDDRLILAELDFVIKYEMITSPLDFFIRRTGLLFFNMSRVKDKMNLVIKEFQRQFGWSSARVKLETENLELVIYQCTQFEDHE
ncbi:MAG: glycerol-3-phosphate dehydrogenase/oxidase [Flammeovirgaceae bacterium]|nr:glycerol-3-phosphate dehydrogenase/oxidase [Flammeovirgaceae bacterium]